jgi:hypothetical protein
MAGFGDDMVNSRRRKKKIGALPSGVVKMTPEVHDALLPAPAGKSSGQSRLHVR